MTPGADGHVRLLPGTKLRLWSEKKNVDDDDNDDRRPSGPMVSRTVMDATMMAGSMAVDLRLYHCFAPYPPAAECVGGKTTGAAATHHLCRKVGIVGSSSAVVLSQWRGFHSLFFANFCWRGLFLLNRHFWLSC
mmetsp:Transcript_38372/g.70878  ORF Transcript_38372/g.70878 Transcript_38372/m.70878 type:complete len:134 (-) Transcript_38372:405-806(-)